MVAALRLKTFLGLSTSAALQALDHNPGLDRVSSRALVARARILRELLPPSVDVARLLSEPAFINDWEGGGKEYAVRGVLADIDFLPIEILAVLVEEEPSLFTGFSVSRLDELRAVWEADSLQQLSPEVRQKEMQHPRFQQYVRNHYVR
jgi:hypothetical protein